MSDKSEDKKEDSVKHDAEGGNLDKLLSKMDAICAKMDAFEAKEKAKDDSAKKDADEKEAKAKDDSAKKDAKKDASEAEEKEKDGDAKEVAADKKDSKKDAKKDSEEDKDEKKDAFADAVDKIMSRMAEIDAKIHKPLADADRKAFTQAQAKCDDVARTFSDEAPRWLPGEGIGEYRRRLASKFKDHSPAWKPVDVTTLADAAFDVAEDQIYAAAKLAALNPQALADSNDLRMIPDTLPSGHKVNSFVGRPSAWMSRFAGNKTYVSAINDLKKGNA